MAGIVKYAEELERKLDATERLKVKRKNEFSLEDFRNGRFKN